MDIVVIGSALLRNEAKEKTTTRVPGKKSQGVERRRNRKDRRKGVRDGVVVSLSYPNDRRFQPDRRTTNTD
ncbi:uncharacterized protein Dvar_29470 [Desulfosarcina variabilis str. Montpellier]|uniref:hypothetical protein n=1 Tax=Desulfosarcina variabilis TaxID=2300 RepID=UPI003AFB5414